MARTPTKPAYDPERRYGVVLARVVQHEGFTFRPGMNGAEVELSGAILNAASPGDIVSARELAPPADLPPVQAQVHEDAEGKITDALRPAI